MEPVTLRTARAMSGFGAVSRLPSGKVVLIRGAAPEETVQATISEEKKGFCRAELVSVVEASEFRRQPFCPLFGRCGGCSWQHFDYQRQLEEKSWLVEEALKRGPKTELAVKVTPSVQERRYRIRVRLHHDGRGGVGLFDEEAGEPVATATCPILHEALDAVLPGLTAVCREFPGIRHLDLNLVDEGVLLVCLASERERAGCVEAFMSLPGLAGAVLLQKGVKTAVAGRQEGFLSLEGAGGLRVPVSAGAFIQANGQTNRLLVQHVVDQITRLSGEAGQEVVELFSGSGNFSFPLAASGIAVRAIELNRGAVEVMNRHAQATGLGGLLTASCGDAFQWKGRAATLLLDPPRTGALELCRTLSPQQVPQVVYVSCDPWTLSRDAAVLTRQGYALSGLGCFDMFPHSSHVESVAVFSSEEVDAV